MNYTPTLGGSGCLALSQYPLSAQKQARLRALLATSVEFVTIAQLRQRSFVTMVLMLMRLKTPLLVLPLEDESSVGLLPVLKLLAAAARAERREIVDHRLQRTPFTRWQALGALLTFVHASFAGAIAGLRSALELRWLAMRPRAAARVADDRRALYLNANLWFGLKAGGSVGHISGVANGLMDAGYPLDFATVGGRLLVDERAKLWHLTPQASFGMPFELNYYRFHRMVCAQVARLSAGCRYSFLYQRLSLGNYSGVQLARRLGVPLIVEYNGSEAWVARNWGRPLLFNRLAEMAEEVMLRHAAIVVTVSDVLRDELLARGVDARRIACYPNCIDPRIFSPQRFAAEDLHGLRAALGIAPDAVVVTFLGTFGQWHGAEKLAEAIRLLDGSHAERLSRSKLHLLFVGDGVRMPAVKDIVAGLRQPRCVTLAGLVPQQEAPRYLAMSDVLVAPHVSNADGSRFFGSPTKLFEYMASGKAILASDLDQIGQVLSPGLRADALPASDPGEAVQEVAVLAQPGAVAEIVEGILFLAEHPRWRAVLGRNAAARAMARYTWRHHVAAILDTAHAVGAL